MNTEVIAKALADSVAGHNSFPDVVRILSAEGVESYRADLVRGEETFYGPDGATHVEELKLPVLPVAERFAPDQVLAAIRDSQAGRIRYPEFLCRVTNAGTASYTVYLRGQRVVYFGRDGDMHVEHFPGARP